LAANAVEKEARRIADGADPNGRSDAGISYVIYGKREGLTDIDLLKLTQAQGFKILGAEAGDYAGYSVSTARDINGDGINDIIVGAFVADPNGRSDAGITYVIYGRKVIVRTKGNDVMFPSMKLEDLDGLAGIDTLNYAGSSAGVMVNLLTNGVSGGAAQNDTIANFDNIIGSSYDDHLTGSVYNNNLHGRAGSDTLDGGAGDDILEDGGGSNDILTGGQQDDGAI
jgi:Ca2+-binding RTX toxin-like protein